MDLYNVSSFLLIHEMNFTYPSSYPNQNLNFLSSYHDEYHRGYYVFFIIILFI